MVGAGLVGLCTAWFLQQDGLEVTVLERAAVAAGASWGNAGWITPALVAPLPDPVILRAGLAALTKRSSAIHIPFPPALDVLAFLARFAWHCTPRRWAAGLAALAPLSAHALGAYDALADGGVQAGAWLPGLARPAGLRVRVQSGRGYSFRVPVRRLPAGPVYLPGQRLACTPMPDGTLRVAGVMEFQAPQSPPDRGRLARMAAELDRLLTGVDTARRGEEWVGARPRTPDGLPVIGPTRSPRIFVAGGHGMWGVTLGPATGRLLARTIVTGQRPPALAPFDPLRRG